MIPQLPQPTAFPQVILLEHFLPFVEKLARLEGELAQMKALQSEWVDTKEALRITGIKTSDTLKRLRELPNALIVARFEGKNEQIPKYLRASLVAYCQSKQHRPPQPGRNLAA